MPILLDLFAGCGGLSLGAKRAGFSTALAVDVDPILSSSLCRNFPKTKLVLSDIATLDAAAFSTLLPSGVDGVVGGPPCQAFSEMGRRAVDDSRRSLVGEFFRVVSLVKPTFFLFENVRGLLFDQNKGVLEQGLEKVARRWKVVGPVIVDSSTLGAPTRRNRVFVFGYDPSKMTLPNSEALFATTDTTATVADAIRDLGGASPHGIGESGFEFWRYDRRRSITPYAAKARTKSGLFTGHRKTHHLKETIARFRKVEPGSSDKIGKYVRLKWDGYCPTLRAGTGSDRGSYQAVRPLHPEEDRVITAREAARLQGFPDDFFFHPTTWHSCRMIGNSVSPIVAEVLLKRIKKHVESARARW